MKRIIVPLLVAVMLATSSCADKNRENKLPDVVTHAINENEKVVSGITISGFNISVYKTYAAVDGYSGEETEVTVPSSAAGIPVRVISEAAFRDDAKIRKITMPPTLFRIERYAFSGCRALDTVVLNDGLEVIGDWAFYQSAVRVCDLPGSVSALGKYCFYGTEIERVDIPANLSKAGKYCFYGCGRITHVVFPERFCEISERMFYNCTGLTEIVIPKTVKTIGSYAFSGCTGLTSIVIPSETEKIDEGAFFGCTGLTIYAPEGSAAAKNAERNKYRWEACDYDACVTGQQGS